MSKKKKWIKGPATCWLLKHGFDMTLLFMDGTGMYDIKLVPRNDAEDIGYIEVCHNDSPELALEALERAACAYFTDRVEYYQEIANEAKYDIEHYEDLAARFPL